MAFTRQQLGWLGVLAVVTAGLFAVRPWLDGIHVALAYLLVVLGGSARGGRGVGLSLSAVAFLAFNFFFLPPYYTFALADPLNWLVLAAFLVTSVVAAQLLDRARREAANARRRAAEVDRLASLGAETLNVGSAGAALQAIADVIRTTLAVARVEIYAQTDARGPIALATESGPAPWPGGRDPGADSTDPGPVVPSGTRLIEWVAMNGRAAVERDDGSVRVAAAAPDGERANDVDSSGAHALLLPLRVRGRVVGVLRVAGLPALHLDTAQRRFLGALSYYAALGLERVRLTSEAEHAEALRQADALKNALLASVSHDLRTPLTTIKALAHSMGADGDERAMIIEEEADRLNRFVADLLDLSRLTSGALRIAPELNAADDLLGAAIQRVAGSAGDRAINARIEGADPLLVGRFDFVHALRILVNLIENALKYAPGAAPVDVTVRRSGEDLEFEVADRGPGISPADAELIFEPFYRADGTPRDTAGTGLGLSIARRLAEAQGGAIHYQPRDGGGSRFILRLPAASIEHAPEIFVKS
jgi:two-component system sensor histidine kinase KdpD